jgi:putative ABC transport system permease protein
MSFPPSAPQPAAATYRPRTTLAFILRMAWRDSRASRTRLLLFTLCMVVGIAALVAVRSFGHTLERAVEDQARSLLGADLAVSSRIAFTGEHEDFLQSIPGDASREITFSTMIVFPRTGDTRLIQARALEGPFPYYGQLDTAPPEAEPAFRNRQGLLVEESLLLQFNAQIGDPIRLGNFTSTIAGALLKVPGESVAFASLAPRVYLPMADLESTGLLRQGSLARYRVLYRLPPDIQPDALVAQLQPRLDLLRLSTTTVQERKEDLGDSLRNLYHFLSLVGFVALLLGGVGIASAIQVHVRQKLPTVAMLRCLGCPVWTAFAIYLVQALTLGAFGAALGSAAGIAIQYALPVVVADWIPFPITIHTSPLAIVEAAGLGFALCLLFALLPITAVRLISPLAVLRLGNLTGPTRDPFRWGILAALALLVTAFSLAHTQRWQEGLGFAAGLFLAFATLAGLGQALVAGARRIQLDPFPFVIRQGWASVHRPQNRTLLLIVSLGLGTFLLVTLQLTQSVLLKQLVSGQDTGRANAILFDIQPDQTEAVADLLQTQGLPVLDQAPIVTMRLMTIAGRPVEDILADPTADAPRWALRREFRSTFAAQLRDSETLVAGTWHERVSPDTDLIPVSVEDGIARELGVDLGDLLEWDVQGIPLKTQVASLRQVDWRRVQPNFFVVFPMGPIDEAPAFHVLVTRVDSPEASAALQRSVVRQFPNVSAIDITVVLRTLDDILGRIAFAIRFMAGFTVITGLMVLVATVLSGRYQRLKESILLRVLGASRAQVRNILCVEYTVLGGLAALSGVILALAATAVLCLAVFKVPFTPPLLPPLLALLLVPLLTTLTGWLASRGVTTHPPLEILRHES